MNLWAILKIAIRALTRNKMRSALTMLGIIIGVGAVIAMVSIGQGAQSMIQTQIGSMGSNMLFVQPGNVRTGGVSQGLGAASTLTEDDVLAMEREIPTISLASPSMRATAQLVFGNQNWSVQMQGTNEKFPKIRNWQVVMVNFLPAPMFDRRACHCAGQDGGGQIVWRFHGPGWRNDPRAQPSISRHRRP
jgi:ABC-type antimicrobial peptide transport system, permease component